VKKGGHFFILSNNHVLADENRLALGSPIFQPGLLDQGDRRKDQLATLSEFVPLEIAGSNKVDCAIAKILEPKSIRPAFLPKVGPLKSPEPIDPVDKMGVEKVGRTTSYTTGKVFDTSADLRVQYDSGNLFFEEQVLIRGDLGSFSEAGDSGSVLVDRATKRPVALLTAGSTGFTVANPFGQVLEALKVEVVTQS